jgi:hypothetical protein
MELDIATDIPLFILKNITHSDKEGERTRQTLMFKPSRNEKSRVNCEYLYSEVVQITKNDIQ